MMKALTVCQPYGHLIGIEQKPLENRTRPTGHRGVLAIHAGKSRDWLDDPLWETKFPSMAFGAVICVVRLIECYRVDELPAGLRDHEHTHGPFCYHLGDVIRLANPVPCRGALGLWTLDADVEAVVRARAGL